MKKIKPYLGPILGPPEQRAMNEKLHTRYEGDTFDQHKTKEQNDNRSTVDNSDDNISRWDYITTKELMDELENRIKKIYPNATLTLTLK